MERTENMNSWIYIYINAYKFPHSQREIVQEMIKDMLEKGVIQE